MRGLGWVEGVEYCPILLAEVECDEVVRPVVLGPATSGYHMWVLIGIAWGEVLVVFTSVWGLPEVEHLIDFLML